MTSRADRVGVVSASRSDRDAQLQALLQRARASLGLPVAFVTRMDETEQTLEVVDSSIPVVFKEGYRQEREKTLCHAILEGTLPPVMGDMKAHPRAMALPAAKFPRLRTFASVPITLSDGSLYGTFCVAGLRSRSDLRERDAMVLGILAEAAAVIIEPSLDSENRSREITERFAQVLANAGPDIVVQPIVELSSRRRVGAEALSRFPSVWEKAPDVCFAEAFTIGIGEQLEMLTLAKCGTLAGTLPGYLSMNVCPTTVEDPRFAEFMLTLPLSNILLELSEQYPVEDYAKLLRVLAPLREAGMRLAIDDVGSGFSSLRHIVMLAPDVIKLDRTIVAGVGTDPVLQALVGSMVGFAAGLHSKVVAEGVEHESEALELAELGVDLGQGWLFGRPMAPAALLALPNVVPQQRGSSAQSPVS